MLLLLMHFKIVFTIGYKIAVWFLTVINKPGDIVVGPLPGFWIF